MDLGRCDLCIPVDSFDKMEPYYKKLGFTKVEGNSDEKWEVMRYLNFRLGLYEGHFSKSFMLNFRGSQNNIMLEHFKKLGFDINDSKGIKEDGTGSFTIIDPDGYLVFFDSTIDEINSRKKFVNNGNLDYKRYKDYETEIPMGVVHTCITVTNLSNSSEFYQKLGLKLIEGSVADNYVILNYDNLFLGLFPGDSQKLTLNFRGGEIKKISEYLGDKGFEFEKKYVKEDDESEGSTMRDPENNLIYFNTHPSENKLLDYLR